MEVILIAAVAKNRVIGKDNALPWHFPEDFKHFKETTNGHAIIMGRKTYESIGKALPNRVNIVLSGTLDQPADKSYFVARSLEQSLALCAKDGMAKAFIIGGARLFEESLEKGMATHMILTEIPDEYEGDTFFPEWDTAEWQEASREAFDDFDIVVYKRITSQ